MRERDIGSLQEFSLIDEFKHEFLTYQIIVGKKLNILIVGSFHFPFGSASASRLRTIAKGLVASGGRVHVITSSRIKNIEKYQSNNNFVYEGVTFESTSLNENKGRKSSRLTRIYNNFISRKKCRQQVEYYKNKENFNVLYIYSRSAIFNIPLVSSARRNGMSIFYDMVEWMPAKAFNYGFINPYFYDDLLGRLISPFWCNGVIVITSYISKKYQLYKTPCVVVPSVFENSKSPLIKNKKLGDKRESFTITYAGACKKGDGFGRLLNAIKIAVEKGVTAKLNVIGTDGSSGRAAQYRRLCEKDDCLKTRVNFKGRVPDDSYISMLSESTCLVLPRPNVQVVHASFPTRLPEFLSTGRPVLTTSVPDVPIYLKENEDAVIVSGDTAEALAEGILYIWDDLDRAERIGENGMKRGQIEFDHLKRANEIYRFIQQNMN